MIFFLVNVVEVQKHLYITLSNSIITKGNNHEE